MSEPTFELWTTEQCMKLKPVWELCRARREAHHIAYRFYNKYNTVVSLPPILIGAILSTLSFNPDAVPNGLAAALAMFITAMSTINSFFALSKSQEGHRQSYRFFNSLVREIEVNMIRGKESPKRTFIDFLEYVNEQFSKAVEDAPTLNPEARKILEDYRNNRVSPFDELLGGNLEATGYDEDLENEAKAGNNNGGASGAEAQALNSIIVGAGMAAANSALSGEQQPDYSQIASSLTTALAGGQGANAAGADGMALSVPTGARREFTALKNTFENQGNLNANVGGAGSQM
jgi:hypothetical protein